MKLKLFIIVLTAITTVKSVNAQHGTKLIGTFSGYVGTVNTSTQVSVANSWEGYLNSIGDSMDIDTLWIDTLHSLDVPGYKWFLFASNYVDDKKAAIELIVDNTNELYEIVNGGMGITVTCSGCTDGCDPKKKADTGNWICTLCNYGENNCTKTTSTTSSGAVTDYD